MLAWNHPNSHILLYFSIRMGQIIQDVSVHDFVTGSNGTVRCLLNFVDLYRYRSDVRLLKFCYTAQRENLTHLAPSNCRDPSQNLLHPRSRLKGFVPSASSIPSSTLQGQHISGHQSPSTTRNLKTRKRPHCKIPSNPSLTVNYCDKIKGVHVQSIR